MGVVRCITVSILDDVKVENDEYFNFIIRFGRKIQYSETIIQIIILENDG